MPTDTCSKAITALQIDLPTDCHQRCSTCHNVKSWEIRVITNRYMSYLLKPLSREDPAPAMEELPRFVLVMVAPINTIPVSQVSQHHIQPELFASCASTLACASIRDVNKPQQLLDIATTGTTIRSRRTHIHTQHTSKE